MFFNVPLLVEILIFWKNIV